MRTATQTICNRTDKPIYVTIELTPQASELEPGEQLTLIFDIEVEGNALQVDFLSADELVIWPNGEDPQVFNRSHRRAGQPLLNRQSRR